jgi:hypothetical protein
MSGSGIETIGSGIARRRVSPPLGYNMPQVTAIATASNLPSGSGDTSIFWSTPTVDSDAFWIGFPDDDKFYIPREGVYVVHLAFDITTDGLAAATGLYTVRIFDSNAAATFIQWKEDFLGQSEISNTISGGLWLPKGAYLQATANNQTDQDSFIDTKIAIYGLI